jgi:hypothetical protein
MPMGMTHTAEQIIRPREVDAGAKVGDVCRQLGNVENTFYRGREKYLGMEPSEARRPRRCRTRTCGCQRRAPSRCSRRTP